jgi:hypothetical protein
MGVRAISRVRCSCLAKPKSPRSTCEGRNNSAFIHGGGQLGTSYIHSFTSYAWNSYIPGHH